MLEYVGGFVPEAITNRVPNALNPAAYFRSPEDSTPVSVSKSSIASNPSLQKSLQKSVQKEMAAERNPTVRSKSTKRSPSVKAATVRNSTVQNLPVRSPTVRNTVRNSTVAKSATVKPVVEVAQDPVNPNNVLVSNAAVYKNEIIPAQYRALTLPEIEAQLPSQVERQNYMNYTVPLQLSRGARIPLASFVKNMWGEDAHVLNMSMYKFLKGDHVNGIPIIGAVIVQNENPLNERPKSLLLQEKKGNENTKDLEVCVMQNDKTICGFKFAKNGKPIASKSINIIVYIKKLQGMKTGAGRGKAKKTGSPARKTNSAGKTSNGRGKKRKRRMTNSRNKKKKMGK